MFLNSAQIQELKAIFASIGINNSDFNYNNQEFEFVYYKITDDKAYRFQIRKSIQGALFADVYCEPYTYMSSIYKSCDNFDECLRLASEWATCVKFKLAGKIYYNKIFISHASKNKLLIDEFVDKILRLSCGFNTSDIIYTSRQTTGVGLGDGIPQFIKDNIKTSSLVLFMISSDYRQSEVCLNEMGAAWALDKKTISILLPDVSFNSLGWLTSLDKAIKINDSEGLDKLVSMISRKELDIVDWNRQKELFISKCYEFQVPQEEGEKFEKHKSINNLNIFDTKFYVRAVTEGEYQYQLDLRLRSESNIVLKNAFIVNDHTFIGDVSNPSKEIKLVSAIPSDSIDINTIKPSDYKSKVLTCISEKGIRITDTRISCGEQISISFVGGFVTTRECDGNVDLPLNNWRFYLSYDIDNNISIPIKLNIAKYNVSGYFWHN